MHEKEKPENKFSSSPSGDEKKYQILGRIAVYDNLKSIPRIIDIDHDSINTFLNNVSQKTYDLSHGLGGKIPYTIIKEIIENLIHANFKEIIITIMDNGNHILISDQGPGIIDKEKAFSPGYTSATKTMKKYIRGVGSGLPIVKETITFSGGSIDIGDNIKNGTVVSLKINSPPTSPGLLAEKSNTAPNQADKSKNDISGLEDLRLSLRQTKILSLIMELEETGPSNIAKELGFSLSTSYRELVFLEKRGLLVLTESGKRKLSTKGKKYLEYYSNSL